MKITKNKHQTANKIQKTSTKYQINIKSQYSKKRKKEKRKDNILVNSVLKFCNLLFGIYLLTKIINFKSVREITSLSCYLLFDNWDLPFGSLIQNLFDFKY